MDKNVVYAEVMQMAQVSLEISFAVHVTAPVEMPPRIYHVSYQEVLVRATSSKDTKRILGEILTVKVLEDYNKLLEDSPILDMFEDPIKYEQCSYVEWEWINLDTTPAKLWS